MPRFFRAPERPVNVLLIVDASGSMDPWQSHVMTGIQGFLRHLTADEARYLVTIVQFAGAENIQITAKSQPPDDVAFYYNPMGGTALFDGMAQGFDAIGNSSSPCICLVFTDGEENNSLKHTQKQIHSLVQTRLWQGNWTFLWLNMQGSANASARALQIECLDFLRDDIAAVLAELAGNLSRSVARMRVEGSRRIPVAGLIGK